MYVTIVTAFGGTVIWGFSPTTLRMHLFNCFLRKSFIAEKYKECD